jgi:hypothetical protein
MPVDDRGNPDRNSKLYEQWGILLLPVSPHHGEEDNRSK